MAAQREFFFSQIFLVRKWTDKLTSMPWTRPGHTVVTTCLLKKSRNSPTKLWRRQAVSSPMSTARGTDIRQFFPIPKKRDRDDNDDGFKDDMENLKEWHKETFFSKLSKLFFLSPFSLIRQTTICEILICGIINFVFQIPWIKVARFHVGTVSTFGGIACSIPTVVGTDGGGRRRRPPRVKWRCYLRRTRVACPGGGTSHSTTTRRRHWCQTQWRNAATRDAFLFVSQPDASS